MVNHPLIAIVGPTASGKTDLALDLAGKFNGEIICADSRTIYKGMDIGTAKPTKAEQARVPHHLLDVVEPGEKLSVGEFRRLAEVAMTDIWQRGKVAFLVGGSGLYIDSVIYEYEFPAAADPVLRAELETLTNAELIERLKQDYPEALENVDQHNRRRLIRANETAGLPRSKRTVLGDDTLVLGMAVNKEMIHQRIEKRIEKMLERGFIDEVRRIGTTYGWDSEALTAIGYRAFKDVALGTKTVEDGAADFARGDRLLVKKQLTWFKRNPDIRWVETAYEADRLVREFLG